MGEYLRDDGIDRQTLHFAIVASETGYVGHIRVFLSATSEDLKEYRKAALDGIRRAGCAAVTMEDFTADPRPPLDLCQQKVKSCDAVVAVVAHAYGSTPKGDAQSYTELECRYAVTLGKPIYAFLIDESYDEWPTKLRDSFLLAKAIEAGDEEGKLRAKVQGLRKFKAWLKDGRTKTSFRTEESLRYAVADALRGSDDTSDLGAYRKWLSETCDFIDIRGLQGSGTVKRCRIEDLYVTLTTMPKGAARDAEPKPVPLEGALKSPRLVIEGDPGSGKSTFLRKIARELLGLPLLVRIAQLDQHIHRCAAAAGLTDTAPRWLPHFLGAQGWGLDERYFEARLRESTTTLLLDGLDEAPDRHRRENMARLFEEATRIYPNCRFVVTTRPRAYTDKAMLAGFDHARIQELDDESVDKFLEMWSRCLFPEDAERAKGHCAELAEALRRRPEIKAMARNPVMLTALAVVHWNERRLPEQRAELYEQIVLWLARSRDPRPGRETEDRCLDWLGRLAVGMQTDVGGRKARVGRGRAADILREQLPEIGDRAETFLDQEEVDSGIVVADGSDLKFWHLTFQEYLAARSLAGRRDADLHGTVLDGGRLYQAEWREVMTLLAGVLHFKQGREKVDGLFDAIFAEVKPDSALPVRIRCVALASAMLRDLRLWKYERSSNDFRDLAMTMTDLFVDSPELATVDARTRAEAAEALAEIGDPRLRLPSDSDYWVRIPEGPNTKAFWIGKYPVTEHEYRQLMGARDVDRCPSLPVTYVRWDDAQAYCRLAGVRLLTDAEWTQAAYGIEGRPYPWGTAEPTPELANYNATGVGRPTPVGLFPRGRTAEGVADLTGNVWEWVEDKHEHGRTVRGGSCYDRASVLGPPARVRNHPDFRFDVIGFRCARD